MAALYRPIPRRANFARLYDQTIDLLDRSSFNAFGTNKAKQERSQEFYANGVLVQWGLRSAATNILPYNLRHQGSG